MAYIVKDESGINAGDLEVSEEIDAREICETLTRANPGTLWSYSEK